MEDETRFDGNGWLNIRNAVVIAVLLATIRSLLPAAAAFVAAGELAH